MNAIGNVGGAGPSRLHFFQPGQVEIRVEIKADESGFLQIDAAQAEAQKRADALAKEKGWTIITTRVRDRSDGKAFAVIVMRAPNVKAGKGIGALAALAQAGEELRLVGKKADQALDSVQPQQNKPSDAPLTISPVVIAQQQAAAEMAEPGRNPDIFLHTAPRRAYLHQVADLGDRTVEVEIERQPRAVEAKPTDEPKPGLDYAAYVHAPMGERPQQTEGTAMLSVGANTEYLSLIEDTTSPAVGVHASGPAPVNGQSPDLDGLLASLDCLVFRGERPMRPILRTFNPRLAASEFAAYVRRGEFKIKSTRDVSLAELEQLFFALVETAKKEGRKEIDLTALVGSGSLGPVTELQLKDPRSKRTIAITIAKSPANETRLAQARIGAKDSLTGTFHPIPPVDLAAAAERVSQAANAILRSAPTVRTQPNGELLLSSLNIEKTISKLREMFIRGELTFTGPADVGIDTESILSSIGAGLRVAADRHNWVVPLKSFTEPNGLLCACTITYNQSPSEWLGQVK